MVATIEYFYKNAWRWVVGLPELDQQDAIPYGSAPDISNIESTQFGHTFVELMRNRMIMGYFRYGDKKDNRKFYDYITSAKRRIQLYEETGNLEHLIDAANILRLEFDSPQHPNAHWCAQDDGEHATKIK